MSRPATAEILLQVGGMTCKHCVAKVRTALEAVEGVESAEVDLASGTATVRGSASGAELVSAVEDTGKEATVMRAQVTMGPMEPREALPGTLPATSQHLILAAASPPTLAASSASVSRDEGNESTTAAFTFNIKGMTCASCTGRIESVVGGMGGVVSIDVNLLMETALVKIDTSSGVAASDVQERIDDLGFRCSDAITPVRSRGSSSATAVLSVQGMTCASCTGRIEGHFASFAGVEAADVQLLLEKAVIKYDPAVLSVADLIREIADLGFSAKDQSSELKSTTSGSIVVTGTSCCGTPIGRGEANCAACLDNIVSVLQQHAQMVTLDVATVTLNLSLDPQQTSLRTLAKLVSDLGFHAQMQTPTSKGDNTADGEDTEQNMWTRLFAVSLVFTLPVFLIAMVLPKFEGAKEFLMKPTLFEEDKGETGMDMDMDMDIGGGGGGGGIGLMDMDMSGPPLNVGELLCWAFTTPVQFIVGAPFYRRAFAALRHRSANMDVLVTLGTSVAYFYSVYIVLDRNAQGMHFFETSAMLITFLTLGRCLEARAKSKTTTAITALLELKPSEAILLTMDEETGLVSSETSIPAAELQPGDTVKVVPGAKIPADGVVQHGTSNVDEAMITGESVPVHKETGMEVIGGTVNGHGSLRKSVLCSSCDHQFVRLYVRLNCGCACDCQACE
jgi:Cu+-exporting ATPase